MLFAAGLGIPLGRFAARHAQRLAGRLVTVVSLLGISIPVFVLGLTLQYIFAVQLGWLPAHGPDRPARGHRAAVRTSCSSTLLQPDWTSRSSSAFLDGISHLILPAIALGSIPLAIITRITRASVLDVSNEDYVRTARAKGLSERRVDGRHIMRNAWLPVVTVIGLQVGGLLAGAVITETVFAWNGVGRCDRRRDRQPRLLRRPVDDPDLRPHLPGREPGRRRHVRVPQSADPVRLSGRTVDCRRHRASAPRASRGLWGDAFRRLLRNRPAMVGLCLIVAVRRSSPSSPRSSRPYESAPTRRRVAEAAPSRRARRT